MNGKKEMRCGLKLLNLWLLYRKSFPGEVEKLPRNWIRNKVNSKEPCVRLSGQQER